MKSQHTHFHFGAQLSFSQDTKAIIIVPGTALDFSPARTERKTGSSFMVYRNNYFRLKCISDTNLNIPSIEVILGDFNDTK